jgi:hypothetical protein
MAAIEPTLRFRLRPRTRTHGHDILASAARTKKNDRGPDHDRDDQEKASRSACRRLTVTSF